MVYNPVVFSYISHSGTKVSVCISIIVGTLPCKEFADICIRGKYKNSYSVLR